MVVKHYRVTHPKGNREDKSAQSCHRDDSSANATKVHPTKLWRDEPLEPPPGLDPKSFLSRSSINQENSLMRLNALAPDFVPSSMQMDCGSALQGVSCDSMPQHDSEDLRHTITALRGMLEEWEVSLLTQDGEQSDGVARMHCGRNDSQAWDRGSLQEIMGKLTPNEAQVLRRVLDSKVDSHREANQQSQQLNDMWNDAAHAGDYLVGGDFASTHASMPWPVEASWPSQVSALHWAAHAPGYQRRRLRMKPWGGTRSGTDSRGKAGNAAKEQVPGDVPEDSLRTFLCELSALKNARVITVRKIKYLGLNPGKVLEKYFSKFGHVERVLVTPTHTKRSTDERRPGDKRLRASNVGFVVMGNVEGVEAALQHGEEHALEGGFISAYRFESHSIDGTDKDSSQ